MTHLRLAIIALSTSLLWGCANIQQTDPDSGRDTDTTQAEPQALEEPAMPLAKAEPLPSRAFPIETFYSLLVAEMAGSRGRYDIELGNYIQEAHRTRDPGVAARATRIARYISAHQATLNAAQLWLELEPDNPEALYIAATELAQSGQLQDAFKHSEKLLELGSTPIFQNIAVRASQATDTQRESLLDQFNRLLGDYPDNTQLLVGKGFLLQQQGKAQDALVEVEKALMLDTSNIAAAVLEAQLLYDLDRPEEGLAQLLDVLQENPQNRRLRLQYARMLASVDLEKAQEQFELLVRQSPDDAELLLSLALVANELGNTSLARESLTRLLDMGEQQDSAHFYLGELEFREDNSDAALAHYQQVEKGPDYLPALSRALDILIARGDLTQARQQMQDVRSRFADNAAQFYLLEAQTLARYQHLDRAESLLTEALTLHPSHTELLYSRAMVNEQRDMIQLTERDLRTIIKYQPNNAAALNALGYTLADRTDRYQEAYDLIEQALNISPDDPSIIDSMGWVHYRLGNHEEALLRLREAMKAFPDHEIAAHLGEVLWVSGETEEARSVWSQGLELKPDSDIIQGVMQRLEAEL